MKILAVRNKSRNSYIANTATVLGAQLGRGLISLLLEVVYARLLGPAGRGQVSLSVMVMGVGVLLGGLGGDIPIMIWAADEKRSLLSWLPSVFVGGLLGSGLAVGLWSLLFWWWHPSFLQGITSGLAILLLLLIPFGTLGVYCLALLAGLDRLRQRSLLVVLSQLTTVVCAAALLFFVRRTAEMGMTAVLLGLLAALLTTCFFFRDRLQFPKRRIDLFSNLGSALNLGIRGQLGNVATFFNYRLDVFVVNYFLGTTQVGLYALGVVISEALWQVPNAAALALVPRTARDQGAGSFTCMVCRQVFALACLLATLLAVLSPWLIPLVFGARYGPSVAVIWWILPGTVALAVSKVMSADLLARAMPEYSSLFAFVALIVTVTLDFLLIPRTGIQGAALASSSAYLVNSLAIAFILKRKLGVPWRALYLPSFAELASYRQVYSGLTTWLRTYAVD